MIFARASKSAGCHDLRGMTVMSNQRVKCGRYRQDAMKK
jgi:hypothetical protein